MQKASSTVTIIVPTRNEGEGLSKILRSIKKYADQILVIDGHSQDDTKQIAVREGAEYYLDNGVGRGDAVRIGIKKAKGDILVFFDADGSHEANDIPRLIEPIREENVDLVISSRRTGGSFDMTMDFTGLLRSAGSDMLVMIVNLVYNTDFTDILYSFRAIKSNTAKKLHLQADDFSIEQEMVIKGIKRKINIREVPSREKARAWGVSKLKTITGIKLMWQLLWEIFVRK
jgi:glycosyltransferase involved in cell wall biosynthesis